MKRIIIIVLTLSLILGSVPVMASSSGKDFITPIVSERNIEFLNKDVYNLSYIEHKEDGTYKIVEKMSDDLSHLNSNIYKLNEKTNKYDFIENIISVMDENKIVKTHTSNEGSFTEEFTLSNFSVELNSFGELNSLDTITNNDWNYKVVTGNTWLGHATISAIIQGLSSAIGAAIGAALGGGIPGAAAGGFIGGSLGTIAQKIYERNIEVVDFESHYRWKYSYPYYDYECTTYNYDESTGLYLGRDYVERRLTINM